MASDDHTYHPKDAVKAAINGTMITGSAGLFVSAVQNTLAKSNVGPWGVFTRTGSTAAIFAGMGGAFEFTRYASSNLREKDDALNDVIGGFLAGSILGLRFGTTPAVLGFGALTAIVLGTFNYTGGALTGYRKDPEVDEFDRKEYLRKNRRRPIEQTISELGEGIYAPGYDERRRERIKERYGIDERFYRHFQDEVTELQEQMAQLENFALVGGERQDAIDHCLAGISRLSNEVTDATGFIPAYDQRTCAQAIKALTEKLQETRSKFAPKARFHFKTTNKNGSAISINDAAELARLQTPGIRPSFASSNESSMATTPANLITPPGEIDALGDLPSFPKNYNEEMTRAPIGPTRKPSFSQAMNVDISGHTGLHIILPSSASRATSSGSITKLDRCIVDMSVPTANGAPFAGLALKNIKSSLIIAGHVAGAAHITRVEDSIIVVASRQQIASEEPVQNHWDQVDDFKWLKAEHSPNWSILPADKRLSEEIWTDVVPGGPGVGLDEILKKVGVIRR
ncbi:hypothetical protein B7494_g4309 [Chlorociboria aeruginascens]|nr:hypothetical protein B7494_g4309 [Chlorociboria aeruginascens]